MPHAPRRKRQMSGFLSAILAILGSFASAWKRKGDENAAADMKKSALAKQAQKFKDESNKTSQKAMKGKTQKEKADALAKARLEDAE